MKQTDLINKRCDMNLNDKQIPLRNHQHAAHSMSSDVICFGGGDWWYHNRGHIDMQIMKRYAKSAKVLYINSIIVQKLSIAKGTNFTCKVIRKAKSVLSGLKKTDADFWALSPLSLPVHHIAWASPMNNCALHMQVKIARSMLGVRDPLIWVACPAACSVALKMKKSKLVYQRTDRFEEYPNVDPQFVRSCDQKLKAAADLTVFANSYLYETEAGECRKALYLDHGVDYDMFASAENVDTTPPDMRNIKRPIVGFFGGIDSHTTDIDFLTRVVDLLGDMSFVFVGKTSIDCSQLRSHLNVHLLGQKPYEQIPHYGKHFDVAIMTWNRNEWIKACNPIKLKEYLALGKPVISTPFPELEKYSDITYQAKTPEEFAACIKTAIEQNNPGRINERRKKVMHASWETKAQTVLNELYDT
ncbi:MAG: glycosyltransferase family 1 protein [Planctomycetes bacterium]|nr:glycosyltransferase family 1 protein [Planctomycetota bacterium]